MRPTLTVVGDCGPEADAEAVEIAQRTSDRLMEAAKAGGEFWALTNIGGTITVAYIGGKFEASALAEEVARAAKLEALGL